MTVALNDVSLAPKPTAINDSPSAMMMISAWRSTKCAGSSRQPSIPPNSGPNMPTAKATSQSSGLRSLETNPATKINPAPTRLVRASRSTAVKRSGSSRAARVNRATCMRVTIRKATPKSTAWLLNAVGTTSAATNIAAIATSIAATTASASGSRVFVSQA
jgi:hypothetical protein